MAAASIQILYLYVLTGNAPLIMDTTVGWGGDEHRPLDDDDDVADKFRSKVFAFNIVERR